MFFRCEPGAHASMVRLTYTKPNAQALLGALPLPHPPASKRTAGGWFFTVSVERSRLVT
jgi:hypothetical protein